jgi:hypothetical protein
MANKFTRIQPNKSRYLEAENALTPLTMLTAAEAKQLSTAGKELIGTNEELVYKYRDEFLHIQRAAEQGLTALDLLIEDPNEFSIVAIAWGFSTIVADKFTTRIVYRKNLGQEDLVAKSSNIRIDWNKPATPTIDVNYYRSSGNAVLLEDSSLAIPVFSKVDAVKQSLGINVTGLIPSVNISYSAGSAVFGGIGKNTIRGSGAVIPLTVNAGDRYSVSYFPETGGKGYRVGEIITVYGNDLFGFTPANNAVFTIKEVDSFGAITNISVTGTAGPNNARLQIKMTSSYSASIIIILPPGAA